jgi:cytosine/adenosine deaminase-related metal-dependent hydrolase
VGLHASFTVGDDTLNQAVDLAVAANSGIHIHVAEDKNDEEDCLKNYNMRVIERLEKAGALQFSKTILSHCLHLDDHERSLVERSPGWVVQNMESNLNNSVGFFNSKGLGSLIMLGTDGIHSDMLRSAQAAYFAGHNFDLIDYGETYRRFRNVHHYLSNNGFSGDGANNLVVLDYDTPSPLNSDNFLVHFLFGFKSGDVCHVISDGKLIVENGNLLTVNDQEILAAAQFQAVRLWKKMK